jgi:glutaconate CoA-transferase subunit B
MADYTYTLTELMAVAAAREIADGEVVFAGTGLPMLGAMLAQRTHAPNCIIIFEAGTVASQLAHLPMSVGDPRAMRGAASAAGLHEVFTFVLQCDIACLAKRTVIIALHEKRRFPERVDYITSPGWLEGGDSRRRAGLRWGGPGVVVTTRAVMRFRPTTHEMYLANYHPGLTAEAVAAETGFPLDISDAVETPIPTPEELRILREVVDPERIFLR